MFSTVNCSQQGFGREKDGNRGKFIGYKKNWRISAVQICYPIGSHIYCLEPIESGHVKINFR